MRNTRLEEGGELNVEGTWRGEGKRGASFQMQKQEKKGKLPPFFAFFFLCFFFFWLEKKKTTTMGIFFSFVFLFLFEMK
jgi:hypothetical protein